MGARWRKVMKAVEKDTQTLFFEPRRNPDEKTRILVRVSYNKEDDVQRYFRWTFLTPQDRVERWSRQADPKAKYKYTSEVSVILGQPRVPPRKHSQICWDEHEEAIQTQLLFWQEWIFNLKVSEKCGNTTSSNKTSKPESLEPFFAELELERDVTAQEYMDMVQYRANMPVHDEYNMSCDILKAREYCHVCCTVAHSFAACKTRGCTVCGSKDHPYYKCAKICKCKTRPPHTQAECPLKSARARPNQEVMSLRRIQNEQKSSSIRDPTSKSAAPKTANIQAPFEWPVAGSNLPIEVSCAPSNISEEEEEEEEGSKSTSDINDGDEWPSVISSNSSENIDGSSDDFGSLLRPLRLCKKDSRGEGKLVD